ncbi:hypothetical protein TSTA_105170 [Talaromyces stipitatus ATCC 10500]|uniref:Band 7 domain-containing protein n=1 Tax=Talaromyces stipitatus (strain ATCC 10500 / CBS 375.48 / QM 6759 / NRRL 1006) TaxID=441959 RepID=B8MP66_TALSN|nr:uncharacterized protein TSTA_105170 [Talaromyces stipitatus ATCC 10500]EED14305.1 hypothetical protein TSTA_105170 [Talaromyces stipitatus ATCC 10500]
MPSGYHIDSEQRQDHDPPCVDETGDNYGYYRLISELSKVTSFIIAREQGLIMNFLEGHCLGSCIASLSCFPCCFCFPKGYKIIEEGQSAAVLEFGKYKNTVGPGLIYINPYTQYLKIFNMNIQTITGEKQTARIEDETYRIKLTISYKIIDMSAAARFRGNIEEALKRHIQEEIHFALTDNDKWLARSCNSTGTAQYDICDKPHQLVFLLMNIEDNENFYHTYIPPAQPSDQPPITGTSLLGGTRLARNRVQCALLAWPNLG